MCVASVVLTVMMSAGSNCRNEGGSVNARSARSIQYR